MNKPKIGFIGAGNLATSMIGGLLNDNYPADHLWASNPEDTHFSAFQQQTPIHTTHNNNELVAAVDIIIFAVKPNVLATVMQDVGPQCTAQQLLISTAAGVSTTSMQSWLGRELPIVRCMPNTPALVGAGATGLYANTAVSEEQRSQAESILRAIGITVWVDNEGAMNVVTALSGSGPAYFFYIMDVLEQAAITAGLPAEDAHLLTLQTAAGAAHLAMESSESLAHLRERVTSKGGTTAAAIEVFEASHIREIITNAVIAAKTRAEELEGG